MIERRASRPPVSYSTFQARDLGSDTATLFKDTVARAVETFSLRRCWWGLLHGGVDPG